MNRESGSLRHIPSVSALLELAEVRALEERWGHDVVVEAARQATQAERERLLQGEPPQADWATAVRQVVEALTRPSLRPVINASGVIVHTNLGRAPLAPEALEAMASVAGGYSTLEYDLAQGRRGSRHVHAERDLCELTGAEAALVVNNNAAAVLLVLMTLAQGREVVISRSQLVEIGGGFRIPEVMAQSGARLVEVGTTNRTYVEDYLRASGEQTALFMYVHRSNFQLQGFVHEPGLEELAQAAHSVGARFYADVGSGALRDTAAYGLAHEPTTQECLEAGADLVSFSGDKLLGGPQAGVIVGREESVAPLRRHPLMRALRVGKLTLAALQATLLQYRRGAEAESVPVWRMIAADVSDLEARARRWREALGRGELRPSRSAVGGGSLPGQTLPTVVLALPLADPQAAAVALRHGEPPVIARVEDDALVLDPRTVLPGQDEALIVRVRMALTGRGDR
ncbi:MAG: L-seryl-tRNA(Sec) selenium transferase [Anaerolineae bacterium]|nr:L-seryl-tRNA(Sec) selenium transferase [Anaerolineae bacterium]